MIGESGQEWMISVELLGQTERQESTQVSVIRRAVTEQCMRLLLVWALNAVALLLVPYVIPGVHLENFYSALVAVLVLGLVNTVVKPIFVLLTLPVTLLTLGLFLFVINALMFWFVGDILSGFRVDGFLSALFGSIVYSVASWLFSSMIQSKKN